MCWNSKRSCQWVRTLEETSEATDLLLISKGEVVPLRIGGIRLGTFPPGVQGCAEVTLPAVLLAGGI
jgi:hypothetical protein